MKRKLLALVLAAAMAATLAGCTASGPASGDDDGVPPSEPPSSSGASPESPAPDLPESDPPSSEPEEETPKELPVSIYLHQDILLWAGPTPVWELTIEEEEELALVGGLLSAEGLTPSSEEYAMFTDGGTSISFQIEYEDHTVGGSCNPKYIDAPFNQERDACTYWSEEVFYDYPRERCEALLAFLEGKGIEVQY